MRSPNLQPHSVVRHIWFCIYKMQVPAAESPEAPRAPNGMCVWSVVYYQIKPPASDILL